MWGVQTGSQAGNGSSLDWRKSNPQVKFPQLNLWEAAIDFSRDSASLEGATLLAQLPSFGFALLSPANQTLSIRGEASSRDLHDGQPDGNVVGEGHEEAVDPKLAEHFVGDERAHERPREEHQRQLRDQDDDEDAPAEGVGSEPEAWAILSSGRWPEDRWSA